MLSQQSINSLRNRYKKLNVSEFFSTGKKLTKRCSVLKNLVKESRTERKKEYYSHEYEKELEKLDVWNYVFEQMVDKEQQYRKDEKIIAYGRPGRILRVNRNGTYDIRFDNGNYKDNVSPSIISPRVFDNQSDEQRSFGDDAFNENDRVMVRFRNGKDYPGRITHRHRNGSYDVLFDNGDFQEDISPSSIRLRYARRRFFDSSQSDEQRDFFRTNDRVWVRFRGGKEYLGTIKRAHSNGTFDVRFDDGDFKRSVSPSVIRHYVRSPSPRPRREETSFCSIM